MLGRCAQELQPLAGHSPASIGTVCQGGAAHTRELPLGLADSAPIVEALGAAGVRARCKSCEAGPTVATLEHGCAHTSPMLVSLGALASLHSLAAVPQDASFACRQGNDGVQMPQRSCVWHMHDELVV